MFLDGEKSPTVTMKFAGKKATKHVIDVNLHIYPETVHLVSVLIACFSFPIDTPGGSAEGHVE